MRKSEIACEILAYLVEHPEAQDTLDGIVQWWLLERKIQCQTNIVREALDSLIAQGFVIKFRSGDSQVHYKINKSKYEEIQIHLKAMRKMKKKPRRKDI